MEIRRATSRDEQGVADALATSFAEDPVWGWALPDPATRVAFWGFLARNSIEHGSVWVVDDAKAVALWALPGTVELDEAGEAALDRLCREQLSPAGARAIEVMECLEPVHPTEPHHYLSLLGTHDDHRGRGLGMALLAENLRRIDVLGEPAYLESTNPANLGRYASLGFEPRDEVVVPSGGQIVTTMWRAVQP